MTLFPHNPCSSDAIGPSNRKFAPRPAGAVRRRILVLLSVSSRSPDRLDRASVVDLSTPQVGRDMHCRPTLSAASKSDASEVRELASRRRDPARPPRVPRPRESARARRPANVVSAPSFLVRVVTPGPPFSVVLTPPRMVDAVCPRRRSGRRATIHEAGGSYRRFSTA